MSSISFLSYGLEEAAWNSPRIVRGKVLEVAAFRFPGSPEVEAQREGESLGFVRLVVLKSLRGEGLAPGQELRIFSAGRWFAHTDATLLKAGVISYAERHYTGGLSLDQIVPGMEVIVYLAEDPVPAGFPPGSVFTSMEGAFDLADRDAEVATALREGPYGSFHHRIVLKVGGRVRMPSGLEIRLVAHSHKRPMTGGPTCESTLLKVSMDGATGDLQLNHVSDPEGAQSWENQEWEAYRVELHGMDYDVSSDIVVRKI